MVHLTDVLSDLVVVDVVFSTPPFELHHGDGDAIGIGQAPNLPSARPTTRSIKTSTPMLLGCGMLTGYEISLDLSTTKAGSYNSCGDAVVDGTVNCDWFGDGRRAERFHLLRQGSVSLGSVFLSSEAERSTSARSDVVVPSAGNSVVFGDEMSFCPVKVFGAECLEEDLSLEGCSSILLYRALDSLATTKVVVPHRFSVVGLSDVHHAVDQVGSEVDKSVGLHVGSLTSLPIYAMRAVNTMDARSF